MACVPAKIRVWYFRDRYPYYDLLFSYSVHLQDGNLLHIRIHCGLHSCRSTTIIRKTVKFRCFSLLHFSASYEGIFQRVKSLLSTDREITKYTIPVSRQRRGIHVLTTTNRLASIEVLFETGFSTRSVLRSYKEDNWGYLNSSILQSVKRGLARVRLKNLHC
jgi:hypothetical protein